MEENLKETLEMVAEYTEADKAKILKKVYICGVGTLITSVASLIFFFITYFWETEIFLTPFLLILASGIFGINTMLAGLQLKGKMSKKRNKKLIAISVTIWVVLAIIILLFLTFVLPTILFYTIGPDA